MPDKKEVQIGVEEGRDILASLNRVSPEDREIERARLIGRSLTLTGASVYKFWSDMRAGEVDPDRETFGFYGAHVQVLDVLFHNGPDPSASGQFGIVVEATAEYDAQQLPRLVLGHDIVSLVDPFPEGFEGADVDRVVSAARDVFQALVSDPEQFS